MDNKCICKVKNNKLKIIPDRIKYLYIEVTNKCNLKCLHCYDDSSEVATQSINLIDIKYFISKFNNLKCVNISGGEPLTWNYTIPLIKFLSEKKIRIRLITNGTLLTSKKISMLPKEAISIQFTLTGHTSHIDSILRGKEAYQLTMNAIISALNLLPKECIHISVMLNRQNYKHLDELVQSFIDRGISKIIFSFPVKQGRAINIWDDIQLSVIEKIQIVNKLEELRKKFKGQIQITYSGFPFEFVNVIKRVKDDLLLKKRLHEEITVLSSGEISYCAFSDTLRECCNSHNFHIRKPTINDSNPFILLVKKNTIDNIEDCSTCKKSFKCPGGCFSKMLTDK